jgi:hypothetical protein
MEDESKVIIAYFIFSAVVGVAAAVSDAYTAGKRIDAAAHMPDQPDETSATGDSAALP